MPQVVLAPLLILFTLFAYLLFRHLYIKFAHPLINVVVLSAAAVICLLLFCDISYESYLPAQKIMTFLLGPATVGLAVPLYRHRKFLVQAGPAILGSVAAGAFVAMFSASMMAVLGGLPRNVVISIMPKGVSIPFAVEVARMYCRRPGPGCGFCGGDRHSRLSCGYLVAQLLSHQFAHVARPCPGHGFTRAGYRSCFGGRGIARRHGWSCHDSCGYPDGGHVSVHDQDS